MEKILGFRVTELHGAWQIQYLDEKGQVTKVKPCLYKEVWELWVLAEAQWMALAATTPK